VFDPRTFIERLAALVPRPGVHLVTYHGVLAPASTWRDMIVPDPPALIDEPDEPMHETIAPDPSVLSILSNVIENEGARSSAGSCTPDTSSDWEISWTPACPSRKPWAPVPNPPLWALEAP